MKSKKKADNETPFQIVGMEVVEVCYNEKKQKKGKNKDIILTQDKFSFQISTVQQADLINNIIVVKPKIIIQSKDSKIEYATIIIRCVFKFKDLSPFFIDNELDIPRKYIDRITSISISSSRGVMFSEFSKGHLINAILPIIDVSLFKYNKMELDTRI